MHEQIGVFGFKALYVVSTTTQCNCKHPKSLADFDFFIGIANYYSLVGFNMVRFQIALYASLFAGMKRAVLDFYAEIDGR